MRKSSLKTIVAAFIAVFILVMLPAAGVCASDTFTPKYSDDELNKIADELIEKYMSDATEIPVVLQIAVGGAVIDGELTGFGESGLEKRVVVSVRYQYYEQYKKMLGDKYGDAVYVEYTPSSKEEYEAGSIVFDDAGEDTDSTEAVTEAPRTTTSDHGTGTSAKTQIIAGIILAVIAAVAIYLYVKKNRKPAQKKKGKKK